MDEAFAQATRLKVATLETLLGDVLTILHGLAPTEVETFQIATEQRLAAAEDDLTRRLQALRLELLDDAVSRSRALQQE